MKRLNKIFLAGVLCFSLGYIANDLVTGSGIKMAGPTFANTISTRTITNHLNNSDLSSRQPLLFVNHLDGEAYQFHTRVLCKEVNRAREEWAPIKKRAGKEGYKYAFLKKMLSKYKYWGHAVSHNIDVDRLPFNDEFIRVIEGEFDAINAVNECY